MTNWIEEYFYYGHGEGDSVRLADGVFQMKAEYEIISFRTNPDIDDPTIKEILETFAEQNPDCSDPHIHWVTYKGGSSSAWVAAWFDIPKDAYLKYRKSAWAKPDGSYSVTDIPVEGKTEGWRYPSTERMK